MRKKEIIKRLENDKAKLWERIDGLNESVTYLEVELEIARNKALRERIKRLDIYSIKEIKRNGNATIVFFQDNDKIVVKRKEGTPDDIYTAVAFAIIKHIFGTNTTFKKYVAKKAGKEYTK